jgi:hypothetical protein
MPTPRRTTSARIRRLPLPVPSSAQCAHKNSWMYHGGGMEPMQDSSWIQHHQLSAGNTGADGRLVPQGNQDGRDWGPRSIGGFVARCSRSSVRFRADSGGIYPALEKGTIDAAEWVGPYDDESWASTRSPRILLPGLVGAVPSSTCSSTTRHSTRCPRTISRSSRRRATKPT